MEHSFTSLSLLSLFSPSKLFLVLWLNIYFFCVRVFTSCVSARSLVGGLVLLSFEFLGCFCFVSNFLTCLVLLWHLNYLAKIY